MMECISVECSNNNFLYLTFQETQIIEGGNNPDEMAVDLYTLTNDCHICVRSPVSTPIICLYKVTYE